MKILYLPNESSQQRQREKKRWIYPVLLAMQAEYHRKQRHDVVWEGAPDGSYDKIVTAPEEIDFLKLPPPDRVFTKAFDRKYQQNGNFKYHPGTYIQVANGCWHGKCTFCVERNNTWKVRDPDDVIDEIVDCKKLGFKEVFDDSGTFPTGRWLEDFLRWLERVHQEKLPVLGCNFRLVDADYDTMARVGFRMLLFGVESANQKTLDRINKGVKVEDIKYIEKAAKAGLDCHVACMIFPWETESETLNTINLVKELLVSGVAQTAQCSLYNTKLESTDISMKKYANKIYEVALNRKFWLNKIKQLKTIDDVKYLIRGIREGWQGIWAEKKRLE